MKSRAPVLTVLTCLLCMPVMAYAYVDPNAGGLLYQILFPVIVAIGAAWAGLRHHVSLWWSRWRGKSRSDTSQAHTEDEADR